MGTPHTSSSHSCISARARAAVILAGLLFWIGPAYAYPFAGGAGEPNDPYQVATAEQLIAIGQDEALKSRHFILTADIDLSGRTFSGAVIPTFSGTLNGNSRRILNLRIRVEGGFFPDAGLFGTLFSEACVRDLSVEGADVISTDNATPLAETNYGRLINCHSSGTVKGDRYAGGLVVFNRGRVTNCSSVTSVTGKLSAAGLVSQNQAGHLTGCHSEGAVLGVSWGVGGLVGNNGEGSSIVNCHSAAKVDGDGSAGGLVGENYGLVIGCYSEGDIIGSTDAGGFIGSNWGAVSNCYSTGTVIGWVRAGGFAGKNSGGLTDCLATGHVSQQWSGQNNTNGFVGINTGRVVNCFWDTDTSTRVTDPSATGLSTDRMMSPEAFLAAGWDFVGEEGNGSQDFWQMPKEGGYPVLSAFAGQVPPPLVGQGTPRDPYRISTSADLEHVYHNPEASYRLEAPIDLTAVRYSGPVIPVFCGTFDGNNQTIRGLTIQGGSYLGLFGILDSAARVHNLAVEDVNIAGWDWIGGLAGYSRASLIHCCTEGAIRGHDTLGGLLGFVEDGDLIDCYSRTTVSGNLKVAGLASGTKYGRFVNCYAAAAVAGSSASPSIRGAIFALAEHNVGGLLANSNEGIVRSCFWDVDASGQTFSAGGEGLTTIQMQDLGAYLAAGWDFTGETANGLSETWHMPENGGYPVLSVLHGHYSPALAGRGTTSEPFVVSTAQELASVCYAPGACYRLVASMDFSGMKWTIPPVPLFYGAFNGNGVIVRGLTVAGDQDLGLFGVLERTAEVRDLSVTDVNLAGADYIGGLAGHNYGVVSSCSTTGVIVGAKCIGGLIGINRGRVSHSSSSATVSGTRDVGGLAGFNRGDLVRCSGQGVVRGEREVGGLIGYNYRGAISRCASTASVGGDSYLGGLIGFNDCATVHESFSTGSIVCDGSFAGGLIGGNYYGVVADSYSRSSVSGRTIAGFVVQSTGMLDRCYSCGKLSGDSLPGGLTAFWSGQETDCFWDRQATGASWSTSGTGLNTAQMKDFFTFLAAGWDFVGESKNGADDVWIGMINDYPQLRWQHGR